MHTGASRSLLGTVLSMYLPSPEKKKSVPADAAPLLLLLNVLKSPDFRRRCRRAGTRNAWRRSREKRDGETAAMV